VYRRADNTQHPNTHQKHFAYSYYQTATLLNRKFLKHLIDEQALTASGLVYGLSPGASRPTRKNDSETTIQ
jgi:hypothetical protein